jgi:hypothetical protein
MATLRECPSGLAIRRLATRAREPGPDLPDRPARTRPAAVDPSSARRRSPPPAPASVRHSPPEPPAVPVCCREPVQPPPARSEPVSESIAPTVTPPQNNVLQHCPPSPRPPTLRDSEVARDLVLGRNLLVVAAHPGDPPRPGVTARSPALLIGLGQGLRDAKLRRQHRLDDERCRHRHVGDTRAAGQTNRQRLLRDARDRGVGVAALGAMETHEATQGGRAEAGRRTRCPRARRAPDRPYLWTPAGVAIY